MRQRIRKNDVVQVISGDHRGARGKVLRFDASSNEIVVEGVNLVYRHVRPTRRNPQGGRVQKEAAIHMSNVMPVDSTTGEPTRVHFEVKRDGAGHVTSKKRMTVGGNVLHEVSRPDKTK